MPSTPPVTSLPAPFAGGKYQLLEELGQGAMGVVYKALDTVLHRSVAIKTIRVDSAHDIRELERRFLREAQAAARLAHPNIVGVHDAGIHEGTYYIVMEFIDGLSLRELLRQRGAFPRVTALSYAIQMCAALEEAHSNDVLHRDIKPDNVIIVRDQHVKLADFGIAKIRTDSMSGLTRESQFIGTPAYMAPERFQQQDVDGRSDLWAVGCVLYECIQGRSPFGGRNVGELISAVLFGPMPKLHLDDPRLQAAWDELFTQLLVRDPGKRVASARELADQLRRLLDLERHLGDPEHDQPGLETSIGEIQRLLDDGLLQRANRLLQEAARTSARIHPEMHTLAGRIDERMRAKERLVAKGEQLRLAGRDDEAAGIFRQVLSIDSEDSRGRKFQETRKAAAAAADEDLLRRARGFLAQQQFEEALRVLGEALSVDPLNAQALEMLDQVARERREHRIRPVHELRQQGRLEEALKALRAIPAGFDEDVELVRLAKAIEAELTQRAHDRARKLAKVVTEQIAGGDVVGGLRQACSFLEAGGSAPLGMQAQQALNDTLRGILDTLASRAREQVQGADPLMPLAWLAEWKRLARVLQVSEYLELAERIRSVALRRTVRRAQQALRADDPVSATALLETAWRLFPEDAELVGLRQQAQEQAPLAERRRELAAAVATERKLLELERLAASYAEAVEYAPDQAPILADVAEVTERILDLLGVMLETTREPLRRRLARRIASLARYLAGAPSRRLAEPSEAEMDVDSSAELLQVSRKGEPG